MGRRLTKKKARKAAASVKRASVPQGKPMPAEEVGFLLDKLQAEEHCEKAWKELTRVETDEDVWGGVEEHLIHQPHEANHRLRRWKYFGK